MEAPKNVLKPRNVSDSTGLAKFHLSPKRSGHAVSGGPGSPTRGKPPQYGSRVLQSPFLSDEDRRGLMKKASRGVLVTTTPGPKKPLAPSKEQITQPSHDELLARYARKQQQQAELQRQKELVDFELLEIEAQIQAMVGSPEAARTPRIMERAEAEVQQLKKKVSTVFAGRGDERKGNVFFKQNNLRLKALAVFLPFLDDVKEKLDQQHLEIEELTKGLAQKFLSALSPQKQPQRIDLLDALDFMDVLEHVETSAVFLDDLAIGIDDYESDEELSGAGK